MMNGGQVYTVSQISKYIKGILDGDRVLRGVLVQGEISNYKKYPSGHHYFSMKDSESTLSCVLFRSSASKLIFRPENGMKVVAYGSVSAYPRDGKYQLICQELLPYGVGDLYVAFEQLKEKLNKEGLFDRAHKKPIPAYPKTIAIITSASGAAVHDMLRILNARWPMTQVKLLGVRVQGDGAARELTGAVRYADKWKVADLIIIGRGGGSMEDLWAFNDEQLARAIYEAETPIISAVGHEPDFVISDFVADLRAATPSNAAELAVPDQAELSVSLQGQTQRLNAAMLRQLRDARKRLERCSGSRQLTNPQVYLQDRQLRLDSLQNSLIQSYERILVRQDQRLKGLESALPQSYERMLARQKQRLGRVAASLYAMNPLKVLGRGYSMTTLEDGTLVTSAAQAEQGTEVQVRLQEGSLRCTVTERSLP